MRLKIIVSSLLGCMAVLAALSLPSYAQTNSDRVRGINSLFTCQKDRGKYTTSLNIEGQNLPIPIIEWGNDSEINSYGVGSNFHKLIPNPDYPEKPQSQPNIAVPDDDYIITIEERCKSVSLRLDEVDYTYYNIDPESEIVLSATKVPAIELRDVNGNVLRDSQGNPFQSSPWVICAIRNEITDTCNRQNMLFTLPIAYNLTIAEQQKEANYFLEYFVDLVNNPGEFKPLQL